ncbi:MAG: tRNA pseudouridine(13) synthase TruD [Conexivisphaerales archaeon]
MNYKIVSSSKLEKSFGILCYGTSFNGIGGVIKKKPEDFVVAEVLKDNARRLIGKTGKGYPLYILSKKEVDTLEAKAVIEKSIKANVNILGLKDRKALTYQFVSARKKIRFQERVEGKGFKAILTAFTLKPLTKADLFGNSFRIVVREAKLHDDAIVMLKDELAEGKIPNYYGPQRFGYSISNHVVGKHIIKKEFADAAGLIFGDSLPKDDPISSLRTVPLQLRRLYVSAYQSYLFNLCVSRVLEEGHLDKRGLFITFHKNELKVDQSIRTETSAGNDTTFVRLCPLPGYSFRDRDDMLFKKMRDVMTEEGVTPSQFYVKEMQELSAEGGLRPFSMIGWLKGWRFDENLTINFVLLTGNYATVLLRELMKTTIQS